MTSEETSHLLCSAAKSAEAAAHLILVPDHEPADVDSLIAKVQSALAFAMECGER